MPCHNSCSVTTSSLGSMLKEEYHFFPNLLEGRVLQAFNMLGKKKLFPLRGYSSNRKMSGRFDLASCEKQKRTFKIVVIGDSGVGKTCLTYRFCRRKFPINTKNTIGVDFQARQVNVDHEVIKLQFWDTAGEERFRDAQLLPNFYRKINGVILVYDVTRYKTFQNLPKWIEDVKRNTAEGAKLTWFLIGSKNDCEKLEKEVSRTKGEKFARAHNMRFYEASAKLDVECVRLERIVQSLGQSVLRNVPKKKCVQENVPETIALHSTPQVKRHDECIFICGILIMYLLMKDERKR